MKLNKFEFKRLTKNSHELLNQANHLIDSARRSHERSTEAVTKKAA